jgi:hypothetical protein
MRGTAVLTAAVALLVVACYTGPGGDRMATILDELAIPDGWELVKTEVKAPDGDVHCQPGAGVAECPSVSRRYLVNAAPPDVYAEARPMIEAAGFAIEHEGNPACDATSAPACMLLSSTDAIHVVVFIYNPGHDFGPEDTSPDRATVIVRAEP